MTNIHLIKNYEMIEVMRCHNDNVRSNMIVNSMGGLEIKGTSNRSIGSIELHNIKYILPMKTHRTWFIVRSIVIYFTVKNQITSNCIKHRRADRMRYLAIIAL